MADVQFATVRLPNGLRLHYAEQGDRDGAPIVFLHGWPDSWFSFSRVMPFLSRRIRAFVLDQRGFGDSERPQSGYEIDEFAADAVGFLDAVSLERATIVGHSFGSFVARRVAITHPGRVAGLVLIGTGVTADTPALRDVQAAIKALPEPVPIEFAREFQASTAYLPLPDSFFERVVAESVKLPGRLWREVLDALIAYDDTEQLPAIVTPTMLMWGDRDALFSGVDQDRLLAAIQGARVTVYPETGHCPNWERPERIATDLDSFVQGL